MALLKKDNRLRTLIRHLRFFFKKENRRLYAACLAAGEKIVFPPLGWDREIVWKNGKRFSLRSRYWFMFPTLCRLYLLGGDIHWREDDLEVSFGGLTIVSPADNRLLPLELDGILSKDHWRISGGAVSGKLVVDIGSHIGVFAVACAKKGALVHAFEPFAGFRKYIQLNGNLNGVGEQIVIHPVGLSNRDGRVCEASAIESMASYTHGKGPIASEHGVDVVEAVSYFQRNSLLRAELIKLNCEGCEYEILTPHFLSSVQPNRISLEFHDGVSGLAEILKSSGMSVAGDLAKNRGKGNLFARRSYPH